MSHHLAKHALGWVGGGLSEEESLEMVLWRPILDGLAAGVCSTALSNSGGVGNLVQRGSVMTLRSILLRHGERFSVRQWSVVLRQVILPAFQIAAEYDESQVTRITSESPSVSSLDFLNDSLPLPPPPNDNGLRKFALIAENEECAPTRPLGQAELLVEASFADLRHGGSGNLSQAHGLAKQSLEGRKNIEQPFPDSWVATTAPIALGTLTDIFAEMIFRYGREGREVLWPIIFGQIQRWAIGYPLLKPIIGRVVDGPETNVADEGPWIPCEALVRIGCKELHRISHTLLDILPRLENEESKAWPKALCFNLADTLSKNVALEKFLHEELVECKMKMLGLKSNSSAKNSTSGSETGFFMTPYGRGEVVMERIDHHEEESDNKLSVAVKIIQLDNGAILYSPSQKERDVHKSPVKSGHISKCI